MSASQAIDIIRTRGTARQTEQAYRWAAYGRFAELRALAESLAVPALRVVA